MLKSPLLKRFFKILSKVLLSLLALVILVILLVQTEPVQNWLVKKVTTRLSNDLHTEVSIQHISITFFNSLNLEGTLVKDQKKDTLLYARQLKVRITDWFFLKDQLVLKYIGLENANIYLNRKDSVWNYQFLVDYFSPATPKKEKKKSNLKLDLKSVYFRDVSFMKNDLWVGTRMVAKVSNMQLTADEFNLDSNRIRIHDLDLDAPVYSVTEFDGLRPSRPKTPKKPRQSGELYFNAGDMQLYIAKLTINKGTYENITKAIAPKAGYFDPEWLSFRNIKATISNFSFVKDTMKANIDLASTERSGFTLKKLKANFRFTPQIMEFSKMDIITPTTHLKNYYAMRFKDFNEDFKHYVDSVKMDVNFKDAEVNSDDIAYFAPAARSWNRRILISGKGFGTVTDLSIKDLFVRAGNITTVSGNLSIVGLPDINTTVFNFDNGQLNTTYGDVVNFIPEVGTIKSPSLASLGNIHFNGNFSGTIHKFKTNGVYSTNLGGLSADVAMELPAQGPPVYDGKIITRQFDIGRFLLIKNMSTFSFDGTVKGIGLTLNSLKTNVTGNISNLRYNDYTYKVINVEGTFQKKLFDGTVKVDDPNMGLLTTVKIDFTGAKPRFNVLGDLANSNFQKLNLYSKKLEISGLFDLNFTGTNINDFLGSVKVFNTNILQDSVRLDLDSLTLESGFNNGKRLLALRSNEFDALVEGKYDVLGLPTTFQLFLNKYFPAYIKAPATTVRDQELNFIISTKNIEGYTHLIDPKLSGFSNSSIAGTLNTQDTLFEINASVPQFAYMRNVFTDIDFAGRGNLDQLQLKGNVGNIQVGDSTNFPNTDIQITSQKDVSHIQVKTRANNTLNELNLNADLTTYPDGIKIQFNPSDFVINDKRWILEKEGQVVIRKNFVSADNVRFTQGEQHIDIQTSYDEEFDKTNLSVKLQKLNLADFAPFVTKSRVEGLISGDVVMKDFFGKFKLESDLQADYFRFDDDSVGQVFIRGDYNYGTGKINYNVASPNQLYNFTASGSYNLSDTTGVPFLTSLKLNNTRVTILNKFLDNIFTDIDGFATGDLRLSGNPNKPDLLGRVSLSRGSLTVNFTKVQYFIDTATFTFKEGLMDFGSFGIRDKFGNLGTVSGKLYQKQFRNLRFDLNLSTSRLLLIDTKANDNSQFYGTAIGRATMSITGPQNNIHIGITGEPVDSSHIFIPTNNTRESADADFIVFKQYGTEMAQATTPNETNVTVDLDLTANPLAKIDVILDPFTGDIIKAIGNGRLRIHAGTVDDMTINGRYEIQSGSYDFNFQSFIKKPFILREEANSFIEWNGDPYQAKLQIEALYVAENVRLGDLVGNQNLGGAVQGYQGDVYVIADLKGKLTQPTIKFRIDFPTGNSFTSDETFTQFLAKLQNDDNEMLKQVTYLIVFSSFAPYGQSRGVNLQAFGANTLSGIISSKVNSIVTDQLHKIFKNQALQFDVNTSFYSSSSLFGGNVTATNNIDRQKVYFKIGAPLMKGKVVVNVGGDVDFGYGSSTATSQQLSAVQLLPDLTVEIMLSKDRKIRAIIFSRSNLDIAEGAVGRRNRYGASLSYRKDFSGLSLKKSKNKPKATPAPAPPAVLTKNEDEQ